MDLLLNQLILTSKELKGTMFSGGQFVWQGRLISSTLCSHADKNFAESCVNKAIINYYTLGNSIFLLA